MMAGCGVAVKRWARAGMVMASLAAGATGLPAAAAAADAPLPSAVTLDDVLKLLAERSPRTAADAAAVDVAAADRLTAATIPNPTLSYGGVHLIGGLSTGAVTQHQVVLEQPLLLFRQRAARIAAANLNVRTEETRVAASLAERRLGVRQAFTALLARQEQLRIAKESLVDLERVAQVVRGRAQAGDRSRYDVARIDTATATLRVNVMDAEADVTEASGHLAAVLGFAGWTPRALGRLDEAGVVSSDAAAIWEQALQRRPALANARERQAAARGGLFLARRERLPVPAVSAGTQVTQQVHGTSAFVGFSLPLPWFDRNQGGIARAAAQLDAETRGLEAELAEARADVERASAVLAQRRDALQRFAREVAEPAPALRRMAEDAYREGSGDILELLDAMRTLSDIQVTRVQELERVRDAEDQVIAIAGLDTPITRQ